jgi:hypothetical protein
MAGSSPTVTTRQLTGAIPTPTVRDIPGNVTVVLPSRRRTELERARRKAKWRRQHQEFIERRAATRAPTFADRVDEIADVTDRWSPYPPVQRRSLEHLTGKLRFTSLVARYWSSGRFFRLRLVRDAFLLIAMVVGGLVLLAHLS